jgi:hypothetical protein
MWSVAAVTDDTVREPRFEARRVLLGDGGESWTVVGPGFEPVEALDRYLTWLTPLRSPREIDRALVVLEDAGRLQRRTIADGRGRPADTWVPAHAHRQAA